jgi:hypothetical protein
MAATIKAPPAGQMAYTTPGTYTFTVPAGVTSLSVVVIGGGGSGSQDYGAAGGNLSYTNLISTAGGATWQVVVGAGGAANTTVNGNDGGASYFGSQGFLYASPAYGNGYGVTTEGAGTFCSYGGMGGNTLGGAGGAAGYIDTRPNAMFYRYRTGGSGGASGNAGTAGQSGESGSGGGGGGGGAYSGLVGSQYQIPGSDDWYQNYEYLQAAAGGGVGLLGAGATGTGGAAQTAGNAGSGGSGKSYGGGGGSGGFYGVINVTQDAWAEINYNASEAGGGGAVRIIWGAGRSYPSNAANV